MANSKILAKITMLSAGSSAPYDSAVVGLTTWDQDLVVGGVTYLKGRIIALSKAAASSGDASRGQGGYASPLELSLTIADRCAAGRLWPLVESGAVPLVGAEVRILNESGDMAPQTWYLHEPKLDGASIKFTLKTMRYLCTKPVSWSATRYDGAATVGLAVGDASVRGINAAGRYKGVSVPTKAFATWEPLQYPGIAVSGNRGNPSAWGAMEYGNTTHPYDYVGTAPSGSFCFVFPSQALRDEFYLQYNGDATSLTGAYIASNSCVLVSDGSNSEIIAQSDSNGLVTYPDSTGTYFTKDVRTINTVVYYVLYLFVKSDGMLASSQASSIQLFFLQQDNPICAGASSVIGFQSKASNALEYGITSPASIITTKNNILYLLPTQQSTDGFLSWTELLNPKGFAWNQNGFKLESAGGQGTVTYNFSGKIEEISTSSKSVPSNPFTSSLSTVMTVYAKLGFTIPLVHFLSSKNFLFDISKIFVDRKYSIEGSGPSGSPSSIAWYWQGPFDSLEQNVDDSAITSINKSFDLIGPGSLIKTSTFDSFDALLSLSHYVYAYTIGVPSPPMTAIEKIYQIVLYAITKLAFGSNPAVVVPGDFPGTSNPTTTPAMAIDQLAAWAGLSIIKTGGWTPPVGVWGRYLGPDPSSDNSADPLTVTQAIDKLASEAWMWVAEGSAPAVAPTIESMTPPVLDTSSIDDVVTLPRISYCYAGTSAQFTAEIFKTDESFDIAKGDGYFWGGWQEKDACHFSTSPGSAVLAMCQLEDCLAIVCNDGYLRCSYDGGVTWPFSQLLSASPSHAVAVSGNGIMVASTGGNSATVISFDAGRTWADISIMLAAFRGGWFDETTNRLWLCGLDSGGYAAVWHSTDGLTWAKISASSVASFSDVLAVGDDIFAITQISGAWSILRNTISGGGTIWSYLQLGSHTDWLDRPRFARWNGLARIAIGSNLWSSSDLSAWTNVSAPAALQAFATDGAVVSALAAESAGGNHVYYSRDQGATWRAVQISPEGFTWVSIGALTAIWDDNAKCFRFSGWGPTRLIALGDPSVLDIWLRCRASYLKTQTLHAETYDWAGIYDADVVVSMLLDAKDGIDAEYQQPRIDWMTKQARFATLKVEFADIAEQLSLTAFQRIAIPRQRLEDSLLASNIPTQGLLTKVDPDPVTGISTIEIIMPPL